MKIVVTGANAVDLVRPAAMAVPADLAVRAAIGRLEIARPANVVVPVVPGPKAAVASSAARDAILIAAKNANAAKRPRRCRK